MRHHNAQSIKDTTPQLHFSKGQIGRCWVIKQFGQSRTQKQNKKTRNF